MNIPGSFKYALGLALLATLLSACGGGGGGGGDDGLEYSGKTTAANIRGGNANDLTGNVVNVYGVVGNLSLAVRAEQGGPAVAPHYLGVALESIAGIRKNQVNDAVVAAVAGRLAQRAEEVDETEDCERGKIRIFGVIDDIEGTGELTFRFEGCRLGGARFDGDVIARVDAFDFAFGSPIRLRMTFDRLRVRVADIDVSVGGSARYSLDIAADEQSETIIDMVFLDNDSGRMLRIVDLVSVYRFDSIGFPTQITIDIRRGRVYDSKFGYVDVRSTAVITFNSTAQDFPNAGEYDLSAQGSILATALNSTTVRIQADTDGNPGNGYEVDRIVNWIDL